MILGRALIMNHGSISLAGERGAQIWQQNASWGTLFSTMILIGGKPLLVEAVGTRCRCVVVTKRGR